MTPPSEPDIPSDPRDAAAPGVADPTAPVRFVDASDLTWLVSERDARGDPGARGERCLIFAGRDAVRRVWSYPKGWRALSAAALAALSWSR